MTVQEVSEWAPQGFGVIQWPEDDPLEGLAAKIGIEVCERRILRPQEKSEARSLSAKHGLGEFPWHTDGAQMAAPPRWLLMRSLGECSTATLFLDGQAILRGTELRRELAGASWVVAQGRRPFYAAVVSREGALRWNPDVMEPRGARAKSAGAAFAAKLGRAEPREHRWREDEAILVDNRRWLHSRPAIEPADLKRELERIHGV